MTIIGNDNFWMLWIIQFLFDVVILFAVILQKPARIEKENGRDADRGIPIPPQH